MSSYCKSNTFSGVSKVYVIRWSVGGYAGIKSHRRTCLALALRFPSMADAYGYIHEQPYWHRQSFKVVPVRTQKRSATLYCRHCETPANYCGHPSRCQCATKREGKHSGL